MQLARFEKGAVVAELDETVLVAARRMRDFHVGCVVVVRDARPVGILTDRDLALRVVAEGRDPDTTRVAEVVTYEAATLPRDVGIDTAVRVMGERGVRRLPIVAEDGKITGIVTADDLVVLFAKALGELGEGIADNVDTTESR
jgi:CBS domain-containing protein